MSETPEGAVLATDHALALRLVTECGDLAQQMHAAGVDTEYKSSLSDVVTAADRACEALVVSVTQQERSSDGVLGEEGASLRGTSGRRWVIDPVDGTHNFTMGIPYWCSALALEGSDGACSEPSTSRRPPKSGWAVPVRRRLVTGCRLRHWSPDGSTSACWPPTCIPRRCATPTSRSRGSRSSEMQPRPACSGPDRATSPRSRAAEWTCGSNTPRPNGTGYRARRSWMQPEDERRWSGTADTPGTSPATPEQSATCWMFFVCREAGRLASALLQTDL